MYPPATKGRLLHLSTTHTLKGNSEFFSHPSVERNPETLPSAKSDTQSPMWRKLVAPKISPMSKGLSVSWVLRCMWKRAQNHKVPRALGPVLSSSEILPAVYCGDLTCKRSNYRAPFMNYCTLHNRGWEGGRAPSYFFSVLLLDSLRVPLIGLLHLSHIKQWCVHRSRFVTSYYKHTVRTTLASDTRAHTEAL